MTDVIADLYQLNAEIKELEKRLKDMKGARNTLLFKISQEHIESPNYNFSIKYVTKVNPAWFKQNKPEFYTQHAHLSHADVVSILSKQYGGYEGLMNYIRMVDEKSFDILATITTEDVKEAYGLENVADMIDCGALRMEESNGFVCSPKVEFIE